MLGARKFHFPKYKKFFEPGKCPTENILFLGLARSISQMYDFFMFLLEKYKKFFRGGLFLLIVFYFLSFCDWGR